jgi:preprotein translocase subunit SecF
MLQFFKNTQIDFLKAKWVAFGISGFFIILGFYGMFKIMTRTANLGVDFSGGTTLEIEFTQSVKIEQLREAMRHPDFQEVTLQTITDQGKIKFILRVFAPKIPTQEVSTRVIKHLQTQFADNPVTLLASEDVGPTVSAHLRNQAISAVFWSVVLIVLYIWWRFDFRFSVAATIATFHDVLAVLGIFVVMNYEINWIFISAILTLAGFSLNDTVVVFDRIRENMRLRRKENFEVIVRDSLNQTLSRTIITSGTVLLVVIALLIWGGEVIRPFSLAFFWGAIIGTYSSIFVASAIVVEWNKRNPMAR